MLHIQLRAWHSAPHEVLSASWPRALHWNPPQLHLQHLTRQLVLLLFTSLSSSPCTSDNTPALQSRWQSDSHFLPWHSHLMAQLFSYRPFGTKVSPPAHLDLYLLAAVNIWSTYTSCATFKDPWWVGRTCFPQYSQWLRFEELYVEDSENAARAAPLLHSKTPCISSGSYSSITSTYNYAATLLLKHTELSKHLPSSWRSTLPT